MKIKKALPPNIKDIIQVFGADNLRTAIFTYGDTVYVPSGNPLPEHLKIHEQVHIGQQKDPAGWWNKYLKDPEFRLEQEVEAYRAQLEFIKKNESRQSYRHIKRKIIKALSSPMYGRMINREEAKKLLER